MGYKIESNLSHAPPNLDLVTKEKKLDNKTTGPFYMLGHNPSEPVEILSLYCHLSLV
jgi:hypothetical protein